MKTKEYVHAYSLPKNKEEVFTKEEIIQRLKPLIGKPFSLSGKSRTDGTKLRKLVAHSLDLGFDKKTIKAISGESDFVIKKVKTNTQLTEEKKGIPKIRKHLIFTYLATPPYENSALYNLQVWNYNPSFGDKPIMFDENGEILFSYDDVRVIIGWVHKNKQIIESFTVMTFKELKETFGEFGKETIKYQMILDKKYKNKFPENESILLGKEFLDLKDNNFLKIEEKIKKEQEKNPLYFKTVPKKEDLFSIEYIKNKVEKHIIGKKVTDSGTKISGQSLEKCVLEALGYDVPKNYSLEGLFPDLRNQLLEIKLQNKKTVDLGQYSPTSDKIIDTMNDFSINQIRYLIAVTDQQNIIKEIILMYGAELINTFHFVPEKNFKCQKGLKLSELYENSIGKITYIHKNQINRI